MVYDATYIEKTQILNNNNEITCKDSQDYITLLYDTREKHINKDINVGTYKSDHIKCIKKWCENLYISLLIDNEKWCKEFKEIKNCAKNGGKYYNLLYFPIISNNLIFPFPIRISSKYMSGIYGDIKFKWSKIFDATNHILHNCKLIVCIKQIYKNGGCDLIEKCTETAVCVKIIWKDIVQYRECCIIS